MKPVLNFTIRALRKVFGNKSKYHPLKYYGYVDLFDQQANDYIYKFLSNDSIKGGKMISKFGTVELSNIIACHYELRHWDLEYLQDSHIMLHAIFAEHSKVCVQMQVFSHTI